MDERRDGAGKHGGGDAHVAERDKAGGEGVSLACDARNGRRRRVQRRD